MEDPRTHIARIGKLAFDRKLLDAAGGNIMTRFGDRVYMSRSYAGGRHQWNLRVEDVLLLDLDGNVLEGEGEFSREGAVHMACYHAFPDAGCVFHAHSLNVMPFVSRTVMPERMRLWCPSAETNRDTSPEGSPSSVKSPRASVSAS